MKMSWSAGITCIFLGLNLLLLGVFVFKLHLFSPSTQLQDFDAYMRLAEVIRLGENPYQVTFMQTLGPPLSFLFYYPFSFLPVGLARILITVLNILSLFLSCWVVVKALKIRYRIPSFLCTTLLLLSSFPVRFSLLMGQPNGILALCTALLIVPSTRSGIQATATSILLIIKSIYIFPLIVLWREKRKEFFLSVGILVSAIGISCVLLSPTIYEQYLTQTFLPVVKAKVLPVGNDYYNQSLRSTLYRVGVPELYPFVFGVLFILCLVLISKTKSMPLAVLSSLLLSPVSWQHYFVVLFPIALLLFYQKRDWWKFTVFLCLWWKDFPFFHTIGLNSFTGIAVSHYFLSTLWLIYWSIQKRDDSTSA